MAGKNEEHEGASKQELLIEACRRNNVELLNQVLEEIVDEDECARVLNEAKTVMGNHLYHEAASRGNYEIIDTLLDQPGFECDPINRVEGDTPLHSAIRWINSEPPEQREFGKALVTMMLEAGNSTRVKNKGGLTPLQLIDPKNEELREVIRRHEYTQLNAGDFVSGDGTAETQHQQKAGDPTATRRQPAGVDDGGDAEFSGSDDEDRVEWDRRRRAMGKKV